VPIKNGTMQAPILDWLIHSGFPDAIEISTMRRGLGGTELWSFRPSPSTPRLVIRLFPAGADAAAEREAGAMTAAAEHGVPVPTIVMAASFEDRPALVTTFASGEPAAAVIGRHPERAHGIGLAMGTALGRLNEVRAPDQLALEHRRWIVRGGPALAPLHPLLERLPMRDRLLHLDAHPNNVLIDGSSISGIIDWENTMAGPPQMELARTLALLRAAAWGGMIPKALRPALEQLERGIVEGHSLIIGPDPYPQLSSAWGMGMTIEDLSNHLGKPDSWVTEELLARLRAEQEHTISCISI
jgi:aminoglycoside phosphotransferase (APT) family kinase protein